MTGARDSALDDLRRAHMALDALEDDGGGKDNDGALDAVKAELAAEKQKTRAPRPGARGREGGLGGGAQGRRGLRGALQSC